MSQGTVQVLVFTNIFSSCSFFKHKPSSECFQLQVLYINWHNQYNIQNLRIWYIYIYIYICTYIGKPSNCHTFSEILITVTHGIHHHQFLCVKISIILFYKMFIVFFTAKILYICIFMTCSTSYCLCDALVDPRNVCR